MHHPKALRPIELYIGNIATGVTVEPDDRCAGMWRIRRGDEVSRMVNLARAKDAALTWADRRLGGTEVVHWKARERRRAGSPVR